MGGPPMRQEEEVVEVDDTPEERGYKWGGVSDRKDNSFAGTVGDKKAPKQAAPRGGPHGHGQGGPPKPIAGYSGVGPWSCEKCGVQNGERAASCSMCGGPKADVVIEGPWECRSCRSKNKEQLLRCPMCGGTKPDPNAVEAKPRGPVVDHIKEAYAYIPQVVSDKKVDPNDPFGDIEVDEWK